MMRSNSGRRDAAVKLNPYGVVEVIGKGDSSVEILNKWGGTNTGACCEKLIGFVRKLEFGLLLVVVGGVHELEAGYFHQPGAAAGVALDPAADFNPVIEPLRGNGVGDLRPVDAAEVGDKADLDAADLEAHCSRTDRQVSGLWCRTDFQRLLAASLSKREA